LKSIDGKNLNMEERLSLLEQIWNFSLPPASVIRRLLRSNEPRQWDKKLKKQITSNNSSNEIEIHWKNLVIWWEEGLNYKFCPYCMKKKSWKDIVAHINNKWTITIHKRNCKVLDDVNKDRLLPAYIKWEQEESLVINVKLILKNKIWILKDVIDILYSMHIELNSVNSKKLSWTETEWNLDLKVLDYDYLLIDRFIERIKIKLNDLFVWVSVDEVRR
jgi:(p)ppGpp synthase/HD superfamily hydrolase